MAHQELELIAKLLDTGDMNVLQEDHVLLDHFKTDAGFMMYKYILRYWNDRRTGGNIPTREMIEKKFPTYDLPKPNRLDTRAVLADFRNYYMREELSAIAEMVADKAHEPDACLAALQLAVDELSRGHRSVQDIVMSQSMATIMARYESNRDQDSCLGIPYPWDVLNVETRGMNYGEFILFYGRPKSMKTWVLLKIATHAYDFSSRRVLVYTREMTPEQMMDRCICLLIGAPYSAYKKGTLAAIPVPEGGTMEDRFYEIANTMEGDEETCHIETGHRKCLIITSDRTSTTGGGVSGLRQKAKDHEVDLICADAIYLMRNDRKGTRSIKWDDQSDITQDIKDLALDLNKPVVATTQANRPSEEKRGHSMANIAFADAYGQNCDLAVEINKRSTPDPEVNELALAITGAREINMTGFAIHGNAASDFGIMMRPVYNEAGIAQVDAQGNKAIEPIIFYESKDIASFFKGTDDEANGHRPERLRSQKPRAELTQMAAEFMDKAKRT